MVAQGLVERDGSVQPRRLERLLKINGGSAAMASGTRRDDFAVNDIQIPPKFVVHRRIGDISQRNEKIKGIVAVQGVCRLNGGVKHLWRIKHDARVDGAVWSGVPRKTLLEVDQLVGCFLVGQMDIRHGKKVHQPCFLRDGCGMVTVRHDIRPLHERKRPVHVDPLAVAQPVIVRNPAQLSPGQRRPAIGARRRERRISGLGHMAGRGRLSCRNIGKRYHPLRRFDHCGINRVARDQRYGAVTSAAASLGQRT